MDQKPPTAATLIFLPALWSLLTSFEAFSKQLRPLRLIAALHKSGHTEQVLSCHFDSGHRFLSVTSAGEKTLNYSDKFQITHLKIYDAAHGKLIGKLAVSESKKKSMTFREEIPVPPVTGFSPELNGVVICRQQSPKKSAEIEFWSLRHKKMMNYLKTSLRSCDVSFQFYPSAQKLAVIHLPDGKLIVWNLKTGVSESVPEFISRSHCLGLSLNFDTVYCLDDDHSTGAYDLSSGVQKWSRQLPEGLAPGFVEKWGKKIFHALNWKLPGQFHNILTERPVFFSPDKAHTVLTSYYSPAVGSGSNRIKKYGHGLYLQLKPSDGSYIRHFEVQEPDQSHLINFIHDPEKKWLLAEDYNPARKNFVSLITLFPEEGQVQRTGSECTGSWDYWPAASSILTCGHCNEKNEFRLQQLKPLQSGQKGKEN